MSRIRASLVLIAVLLCSLVIVGWFILNYQSQVSRGRFGIHLLENDELVVSDEDIISYNKTSHEIKLTEKGIEKIRTLKVGVSGRPFVIKLDGREIYDGSFWHSLSSIPYSGIVINTYNTRDNTIRLEEGYPTPKYFKGIDPRNNSEIFDHFQRIEKLAQ